MRYLREDFVFVSVKRHLSETGWRVIGGEPPDGTADDLIRVYIRPATNARGRLHSLGSQKVDLISIKDGTLLLTELKPSYSEADRKKLDRIAGPMREDLLRAIWQRCKIPPESIKSVVKSLGFTATTRIKMPPGFVVFCVHADGRVVAKSRDSNDSKLVI